MSTISLTWKLISTQGKVFLAVYQKSKFALKTCNKNQTSMYEQLSNELDIISRLPPHKHLLPLCAAFENKNSLSIVTPYCEGGNLMKHIENQKSGRMNHLHAWELFRQIVSAVSFMHSHGFVHRDLKAGVCVCVLAFVP